MSLSFLRFDRERPWRFVLGLAAGLGVGALGTVALAVALVLPQLPPLDRVTDYQPRQPLAILTSDGVEIAQFGAEQVKIVNYPGDDLDLLAVHRNAANELKKAMPSS